MEWAWHVKLRTETEMVAWERLDDATVLQLSIKQSVISTNTFPERA